MKNRETDRTLAHAIQALGTPDFAGAYAALLRCYCTFDNLIIIAYNGEKRPTVLYREYTDPIVYQPMDSEYLGSAYLLDPFYHQHRKGDTHGIIRLRDIAPDHFRRTQYYKTYYQQTTLLDEMAVFATVSETVTLTACLGRDRSSGAPFSKREIQALHDHEDTLSALAEKHWQDFEPGDNRPHTPAPLGDRLREALKRQHDIKLSPRQAEVALFILRGHSSLSIGLHLDVSPQTVKVFRRQLYAKCGISSQAELFALLMPLFARLTDET
ncbi:LuxR family transcriptional regulator [Marinobacter sp. R17]|uniref:helix-turn-helix transcriptional regulator n=1 Tax=Marinobacter TaxID=2742 RepID=UPI000F4B6510|nr:MULTISPECIES: helix-turn-helix transcriptional regulator [Marinobacter]ROT93650.1 LuxR family transcriptional regulator [Marinobacter sp. R17]